MELFSLLGKIAIDNTEANKAIDESTKKAKGASKEQSEALGKIGSAAATLGKGVLGAGAVMGGAFVAAVEGTREYRQEMGLLESAFQTAGHSTEEAKSTYSDLNAVMGDSGAAVEAAQHIALVADNEKEMGEMTHMLTGVYATFGSSLPLEGLSEAINHSSSLGEVQGSLADALEWSGITVDDFNKELEKCSSEEERQDLIMKTLNDTYSDAADQYKKTNKDIMESQKAQERLTDAMAEVGKVGEPIMTAIRNFAASLAEHLAPALETAIQKIKDMRQWMQDNQQTVQMWIGIILGAVTAISGFILVMQFGAIMTAASNAIKTVRLAMTALNTAFLANPIGMLVAALAGLVIAFIYLWNNVDGFKQFWIDTWEIIKDAASAAWEWIKKASSDTWDWIVETWNSIGEWFSGQFDEIAQLGEDCMNAVSGFFSDAWEMIKKTWSSITDFFENIWAGIRNIFSAVGSFFQKVFQEAVKRIKNAFNFYKSYFLLVWNGIKNIFSTVSSWFKKMFQNAVTNIKNAFNFYKTFFSSVWSGIQNVFKSVGSWFSKTFSNAWTNIKKAFANWGSFFGGLWDQIKKKFSSIGTTLGSTMSNAVKTGMNAIIGKIESTINTGLGLINKAIKLANKLGFSVGEVGTLKLPRLAKGGIINDPTAAILGDAGAEAVVPLENNTQWLDYISARLNQTSVDAIPLLKRIIALLEDIQLDRNIYLDSNVLVGELTPAIDRRLGYIATKKNRGNI